MRKLREHLSKYWTEGEVEVFITGLTGGVMLGLSAGILIGLGLGFGLAMRSM